MEPAPRFGDEYRAPMAAAARLAGRWIDEVGDRPIVPRAGVEQVKDALGRRLPDHGVDATRVVEDLAAAVEPGLMAMQSPRFFGWVIGGTAPAALAADWLVSAWDQNTALREVTPGVCAAPAALAADWLVSAWDQNTALREVTPGVCAAEELAGEWACDVLGLPEGTVAGFTTSATTANTVALAAARHAVLARAGWDDLRYGIQGAPRIRVLAGAEHHPSVDVALRYLGLGLPVDVPSDGEGRIRADALEAQLAGSDGPAIVCLQAGNIHSGASDPFEASVAVAHAAGAWVHVDGAFGLWAAASPRTRDLVAGVERADSWATDAHKTLNVPYDAGIVAVADPAALVAAMAMHAAYLPSAASGIDSADRVLELSRRARGVPTFAALRTLGRDGVAWLVDGLVEAATALADGLRAMPGVEVLNEVVFTQVSAAFDGRDVGALAAALDVDGVALAHPSRWHDRDILRFSVSNRGTDAAAVEATLAAVRRALAAG